MRYQISNDAPKIVLNKIVSVRFDTNVNNLPWDFKAKKNVIDVKVGQVNKIEFVDEEIEKLQKKVAEKYGYTLVDHKLELYGIKKKLDDAESEIKKISN